MINSHVHLIPEHVDHYAETLLTRMNEHGIDASVVFGSQCEQAVDDSGTRRMAARFPDAFIPFLSRSVDIARDGALDVCLRELETGFWRGIGELFLDCTDDMEVRWTDEAGNQRCVLKPVPEEKEKHPLYKALFEYAGTHDLPVLVHCMDADVMARTLLTYPATTFIWAHVDHEFYWDVAIELLGKHPNLFCEFGVEFRFLAQKLLSGQYEDWFADHIDRWRRTCVHSPDRVIWGTDLYTWDDLEPDTFATTMQAWECLASPLDKETRQTITHENIARLLRRQDSPW